MNDLQVASAAAVAACVKGIKKRFAAVIVAAAAAGFGKAPKFTTVTNTGD